MKISVCAMMALTVLGLSMLAGCSGPAQLNPYALAAAVNRVDNTDFFDSVYSAFQSLGASVAAEAEDAAQSNGQTQQGQGSMIPGF